MNARMTEPGSASASGPRGERFGHFVLEHRLGGGTMGEVWLARNTKTDPDGFVAVKRISRQYSEDEVYRLRFRDESAVISLCRQNPNVVDVYSHGWIDDQLYLEMEFVEGSPLSSTMRAPGPHQTGPRAVDIIEQMASALDEVHKRGVEHRDVKPGNVLIRNESGDGREVVMIDFGIASLGPTDEAGLTATSGKFIGTAYYAAPEQWPDGPARGKVGAMDVFALGAVLFHLLTGRTPYPGSAAITQFNHRRSGPPPGPDPRGVPVPAAFVPVFERAMAWDPHDRYPSALTLAVAARSALEGRPLPAEPAPAVTPRPEPDGAPPGRAWRRRPLTGLLTGVVVVALAATGAVIAAIGDRSETLTTSAVSLPVLTTDRAAVGTGPTGPRAFVGAGGAVLVVDLRSRRVVGTVPVPGAVTDVAASADGTGVYLSSAGTVVPLDAATLAPGTATRLPTGPGHIAVAGSGPDTTLYVPGSAVTGAITPGASFYRLPVERPSRLVAAHPTSGAAYGVIRADAGSGFQLQRVDAPGRDTPPGPAPADAAALAVTGDDVWLAGGQGLLRVDPEDLRSQTPVAAFAGVRVRSLAAVDDDLYVLTDSGRLSLVRDGEVVTTTVASPGDTVAMDPETACGVIVRSGTGSLDVIDRSSGCLPGS